jgi:hypothetical protein
VAFINSISADLIVILFDVIVIDELPTVNTILALAVTFMLDNVLIIFILPAAFILALP